MITFFKATTTAANALYGDFTFKPFYNFCFHLEGITTFFCHILRALYDLTAFCLRLIVTPFCLLNPFSWPSLPGHLLETVDDIAGFAVSLVTIAIHPIIFVLRTLTSLFRGYEEGTDYDWGVEEEEKHLNMAMAIW